MKQLALFTIIAITLMACEHKKSSSIIVTPNGDTIGTVYKSYKTFYKVDTLKINGLLYKYVNIFNLKDLARTKAEEELSGYYMLCISSKEVIDNEFKYWKNKFSENYEHQEPSIFSHHYGENFKSITFYSEKNKPLIEVVKGTTTFKSKDSTNFIDLRFYNKIDLSDNLTHPFGFDESTTFEKAKKELQNKLGAPSDITDQSISYQNINLYNVNWEDITLEFKNEKLLSITLKQSKEYTSYPENYIRDILRNTYIYRTKDELMSPEEIEKDMEEFSFGKISVYNEEEYRDRYKYQGPVVKYVP